MVDLGLDLFGPPIDGLPAVRGASGCVIRWGSGWFEEVREGIGWNIPRKDKAAISVRVELLLKIFSPKSAAQLCLEGTLPFALEDG